MSENNSITPVQQRVLDSQFEQLLFEIKKVYIKCCSLNSEANAMDLLEDSSTKDSAIEKIGNKILGTGLHEDLIAELFSRYVKVHDPEFYELMQTIT